MMIMMNDTIIANLLLGWLVYEDDDEDEKKLYTLKLYIV